MRAIDADALHKRIKAKNTSNAMMRVMKAECLAEIDDAPTIEPERKNGKWMPTEPDAPCFYRCDHCGRLLDFPECFCPTCGTDMRGEQDED